MKAFFGLVLLLVAQTCFAEVEQFGFWPGSQIVYMPDTMTGYVVRDAGDEFRFNVDGQGISDFLACATGAGAKYPVFLKGIVANGQNIVSEAFICRGQINLGNCTKKQYTCANVDRSDKKGGVWR